MAWTVWYPFTPSIIKRASQGSGVYERKFGERPLGNFQGCAI